MATAAKHRNAVCNAAYLLEPMRYEQNCRTFAAQLAQDAQQDLGLIVRQSCGGFIKNDDRARAE